MQLTDLKPCAACGGPIVPLLYTVKAQQKMVDMKATNEQLGMMQFFGGSPALADVFSPRASLVKPISVEIEITLCQTCFLEKFGEFHDRMELCVEAKAEAEKVMRNES